MAQVPRRTTASLMCAEGASKPSMRAWSLISLAPGPLGAPAGAQGKRCGLGASTSPMSLGQAARRPCVTSPTCAGSPERVGVFAWSAGWFTGVRLSSSRRLESASKNREEPGMSFLDGLNPEQRLAAEHDGGHLLILAGAGTGKTRTLVHRLGWLLEQGQPAHQLLVITFTNKAAAELKERLKTLVGHKADAVISGTFHGVAARVCAALRLRSVGRVTSSSMTTRTSAASRVGLLSSADQVTPGGLLKAMEQRRLNPEIAVPTWDRAGQLAKGAFARVPSGA